VIQRPPYKSETSTPRFTHAISWQVVEMLPCGRPERFSDGMLTGEGVLNLLKDQKAMENYGVTSIESHGKNSLLVDLDMLVCKEDLDRVGIAEDRLLDAEDMARTRSCRSSRYAEIQRRWNLVTIPFLLIKQRGIEHGRFKVSDSRTDTESWGRVCPYPLVLTKKALEKAPSGGILKILCDAPASAEDSLPRFAQDKGMPFRSLRLVTAGRSSFRSRKSCLLCRLCKAPEICSGAFL